jgi:hypothetical protein
MLSGTLGKVVGLSSDMTNPPACMSHVTAHCAPGQAMRRTPTATKVPLIQACHWAPFI